MPAPDIKICYMDQTLYTEPDPDYLDVVSNREKGVVELVRSTIQKYNVKENFIFTVRVADAPWESDGPEPPPREVSEKLPEHFYGFCVYNERYHKAFPDYIYVGKPEAGLKNYTETVNNFVDSIPQTNKIGWIGAYTCGDKTPRPKLGKLAQTEYSNFLEVIETTIPIHFADGFDRATVKMTYQEQIDKWKYLIDVEGCGWSGRFKVLMSSPRIVFFVDRPYQEWYFGCMEPWKHYVPVKRDLSDLKENYERIESDIELQNYIKQNKKLFAQTYLTREAAEKRVYEIILDMINYYKTTSIANSNLPIQPPIYL